MSKTEKATARLHREASDSSWLESYPRVWHMLTWAGAWHKEEAWRPIPRYMGLYEASDWGRIRSLWFVNGATRQLRKVPLVLTPHLRDDGRPTVTLVPSASKHVTEAVYRLVLEAFLGPCPDGYVCAHYDGNAANNTIRNLRWTTYKENEADKARHGRVAAGERNASAKLDEPAIKSIRRDRESGESFASIGRRYGVSDTTIHRIVTGRSWRAVISNEREDTNIA